MDKIIFKEIKQNLVIDDISLYIFLFLCFLFVLFILIIFFKFKDYISNKKLSIEEQAIFKLKNLNFNNSKQTSYEITRYAKFLANSHEKKLALHKINLILSKYKYKKEVSDFSSHDKNEIIIFLEYYGI